MSPRPVLIAAAARDPFIPELVRDLQSEGREVVVSRDAAGALRAARAKRPALVVLDSVLPDGDGLALCRQLKADPATTDIPVFCFSVVMARDRCAEAGADAFLLKPVERELLLKQIREVLDSRVTQLRRHAR